MSRAPMHPLLKMLIGAVVIVSLYAGLMFAIAYIRFSDIKGKVKEATMSAVTESDANIATKLAETALDDKLPIAGDYFFQVRDAQGKISVLTPESEQQQKEYIALATAYFANNITYGADRSVTIILDYDQEVYFPFNMYKHTIHFHHEETQQPPR
jgi:hypothetical protein